MIAAIDIGNTNHHIAIMDGKTSIVHEIVCPTWPLPDIRKHISNYPIAGCVISCVVSSALKNIQEQLPDVPIVVVNSETAKDLFTITNTETGSDIIATCVAATDQYPNQDVLIITMGTAITMVVADTHHKIIKGACIIPGMQTALHGLKEKAPALPSIVITRPAHILGKNTIQCMQSGLLHGYQYLIEGMVTAIQKEYKKPLSIILTGGEGQYFNTLPPFKGWLNLNLTYEGLWILYHHHINNNQEHKG